METPKTPTDLSHRIREGLSRVATAMRIDDWRRSKTAGLNPTQLSILELLEGRTGGMGVKDIAAQLGVSQPTATDSIAALERKGLVLKRGASADRRAVTVEIAAEGRSALWGDGAARNSTERAVEALPVNEQQDLLITLVKMIGHLQSLDAIPIQRMCATCRYFAPFAHADAERPHHCHFVNAAFGQRDIRIDCREHETADPASRAATWDAFREGSASPPPGS
ncbi:MarR family winged helix-turn-helix transcriptional regulator [Azospirillum doebereinerae]